MWSLWISPIPFYSCCAGELFLSFRMRMQSDEMMEQAKREYRNFTDRFQSAVIASVDTAGNPNASYAPFVRDEKGDFYLFLSGLARHTPNLFHQKKASLLFLEDEKEAENIFARKRLTYGCQVSLTERESPGYAAIDRLFEDKFGSFYGMLRTMPDFRMFRLHPLEGLLVLGFGLAYRIEGDSMDHLTLRSPGGGETSNPHTKVQEI